MIDPDDLRNVVAQVLHALPAGPGAVMHSPAAMALMMRTALVESGLRYLRQRPRADGTVGPALGPWQMEPATHDDIWRNWLAHRPPVAAAVKSWRINARDGALQLEANLYYAAAMARVHYFRVPAPLPDAGDLAGQARYWKVHYNTAAGAGTVAKFIRTCEALPEAASGEPLDV